jgi:hypothetical protein
MSAFSAQALEDKITHLSLSQDSIETLSLWITQYKAYAKDSVEVWLTQTKKGNSHFNSHVTYSFVHFFHSKCR